MNRFKKPGVAIATLLLAFPNLWGNDEPKWYDTTDHFTVRCIRSDEYGDFITVAIEGTENHFYMAYNFDIILPAGVTFPITSHTDDGAYSYDSGDVFHNLEDGIYPTSTTGRPPVTLPKHSLSNSIKDYGTRAKVICLSFQNDEFLQPTGAICDCYVTVHPLAKAGVNTVKLKDMVFNTKNHETGFPIQWAPGNTLFNVAWATMTIPAERTVEVNIPASAKWGTLILPFALAELPEGVSAYHAARINNTNEVELEAVTELEAYKPYIIHAPQGWKTSLTGTASADDFPSAPMMMADDDYSATYPADAIAQHGVLNANIRPHQRTEGYVLTTAGEKPAFTRVTESDPQVLATGDAFISTPEEFAGAAPDKLDIKVLDSTTSVREINAEAASQPIYNLQGQRVAAPRAGQLYVSHGRIFRK